MTIEEENCVQCTGLRDKYRDVVIEAVKESKCVYSGTPNGWVIGYNEAIDDVLSILNEKSV